MSSIQLGQLTLNTLVKGISSNVKLSTPVTICTHPLILSSWIFHWIKSCLILNKLNLKVAMHQQVRRFSVFDLCLNEIYCLVTLNDLVLPKKTGRNFTFFPLNSEFEHLSSESWWEKSSSAKTCSWGKTWTYSWSWSCWPRKVKDINLSQASDLICIKYLQSWSKQDSCSIRSCGERKRSIFYWSCEKYAWKAHANSWPLYKPCSQYKPHPPAKEKLRIEDDNTIYLLIDLLGLWSWRVKN